MTGMLQIIQNGFWFLVVTCVLVAWHEFGHFWVGKKCGVKILRYAIGFGPTLWRRVGKDDVEYAINAIPLGGYVKFADTRDGSADPADHARAFDQQSLGKRSLIVLAGPVANLLLAIVGFAVMHMVGVQDDRPVIGAASAYVAEAGFERGDEIVRVGETEVDNWTEAAIELVRAGCSDRLRSALEQRGLRVDIGAGIAQDGGYRARMNVGEGA